MPAWVFQGNPDKFDVDEYLRRTSSIVWSVRQEHLAQEMREGDELFLWRAAGQAKAKSGIIAAGYLTSSPSILDEDSASEGLWREHPPGLSLRVRAKIDRLARGPREVVDRKWLLQDPIVADLRVLRMANETNYRVSPHQASRLRALMSNTGRDWNRDESLAGLWAYAHTQGESVSRLPDSPVAQVSVAIGRAVTGVYNKVMNFRAIDPRDERSGLTGGSNVDEAVWAEFFDAQAGQLDIERLDAEFAELWASTPSSRKAYADFGDAPNDDPTELQTFSARVRKGQPAFRKNLLAAYGSRCAISGWGPEAVLEAVHIVPHSESGVNALDNGLLLRADLHHLLDLHLLSIDPDTFTVRIDERLRDTDYWLLHGGSLRPRVDGAMPDARYYRERWGEGAS